MANNPNLINEEQPLPGNWSPVDFEVIQPGKAPSGAPAPHDMPDYFAGSLAPQLQQNVSYVATETAKTRLPIHSLMPFGLQSSAFTNAATQSTSTTTVVPSTPSTEFYQTMQASGSALVQRPILNFLGDHVLADNASNSSTDVELGAFTGDVSKAAGSLGTTVVGLQGFGVATATPTSNQVLQWNSGASKWTPQSIFYQTVQKATVAQTQRAALNFTPGTVFNITDNSGNGSTDVALFADVANGVPLLDSNGYLKLAEQAYGINAQTGTTYAIANTDRWKLITLSNASAVAVSIAQAGSGGNFASGWSCLIINEGAGTVTITPTTSTIDGQSSLALTQRQGIILISDGTNYFTIRGISSGSSSIGGVNVQTSGPYTLLSGDNGKDVVANSGSAITFKVPASPPSSTWMVFIQNIGAGVLTIDKNGLTIDGAASNLTLNQNQGVVIFTDGTNYFTERGMSSGSTINFSDSETPSGSLPGTSFTLAHTPNPAASLQLFWNGQLLKAGGADYTLSGTSITTVSTIGSSDVLLAWYRY